MASFQNEDTRIIDKFNEGKFNLWKFKIKLLLVPMDLWDSVDWSKKPSPSNADSKVLKEYQKLVKKAMSMIGLNVADNQLTHIKSCKKPVQAWKILYNIHETKSLSKIFFIRCKFLNM